MRGKVAILMFLAVTLMLPARSAPLPLKPATVVMTELYFNVRDVEGSRRFWQNLGGMPDEQWGSDVVRFPGVVIFLKGIPQGRAVAPSAGSILNHVGFQVPNLSAAMERWKTLGMNTVPGQKPGQGYIFTPDNLMRVEVVEELSLTVPIAFHHIHFLVPDPKAGDLDSVTEMQKWYVDVFHAKAGMRGSFQAADLPGANLTFSRSPSAVMGTKGRFLDHIGFEVEGMTAFCRGLETTGIKFDGSCTASAVFLTDPWGTYIELDGVPVHR